jgi:hypothetical protein
MRPPIPFTLRTQVEPQPEDALEQFEQALSEFIEVIVRSEVNRLRQKNCSTPQTDAPSRS